MAQLKHSIPAFSLIDVIVAMIIVMLSFVITVHLFVSIQRSSTNETEVRALLKMDEMINVSLKADENYAEYKSESFEIFLENTPYQPHPELNHIRMVALKPNGDTLAYQQYLLFDYDE